MDPFPVGNMANPLTPVTKDLLKTIVLPIAWVSIIATSDNPEYRELYTRILKLYMVNGERFVTT